MQLRLRHAVWVIIVLALAAGCSQQPVSAQPDSSLVATYAQETMSVIALTSPTAAQSSTPTATFTPAFTSTPEPTITPTWAVNPPGSAVVPILLYHHISDDKAGNRYYVPVATFEQQMQWLHDHGYTAITISQLVDVLMKGGPLPARPVAITFDDGNEDVYKNAFPILKRLGYPATSYIIVSWIGAKNVVSMDELKDLIASGWEIGNHTMTHIDLTKDHSVLNYELVDSRDRLEKDLGITVNTVAYPFGAFDPTVGAKTSAYGYLAGLGLGTSYNQGMSTLYYLSRMEVQSSYDMQTFINMLPWH
ncbi:MAG: polysaccharide deacetylase family protein [Anaerolineaceae bacterium]|jgi:peptidoglycan/xylan/chitin deacetylase (PgdA/CDA1 family)